MFKKRHPAIGSRPGTLVIPSDAPRPSIRLIQYSAEEVREQIVTDREDLRSCRSGELKTWVDVQGLGDEEMLLELAEIFNIHPLALEDIVNIPQRAKCELYDDQHLIICRCVEENEAGEIRVGQVSIILGADFVLTFQERSSDAFQSVRQRMERPDARLRHFGPDYLAYAIVDSVVDGCFPVLEALGERIERLEDLTLSHPTPRLLRELGVVKNQVARLQRTFRPQTAAVDEMMREESPLISQPVQVFLRDVHDHCMQTAEVIDMYREMMTGLLNTYLSSLGQKTNEVMKVLTIVGSIFIPLTFLAGIYGMNFEHMPELNLKWAYPLVWLTMLGTAGVMLLYFWRKGWIGSNLLAEEQRMDRGSTSTQKTPNVSPSALLAAAPGNIDEETPEWTSDCARRPGRVPSRTVGQAA